MKKFLFGILAGLIIAGVTVVVFFFAALKFSRRAPEMPSEAWLSLRLDGALPEAPPVTLPFPAFEDKSPLTVVEVWSALHRAASDPRIKGVMLRPRGLAAGWGKIGEIRQGIEVVRKAGKPVYVWLTSPNAREYYLATAADRIFLSPEDFLDLKGMRIEATYWKGTLDKIGVAVEIEHAGKYKDAGDTFSRSSMSPETKEVLNSILDVMYGRLCEGIGASRKMTTEQVKALIDDGPFIAPAAKAKGLVDDLIYEQEAVGQLAKKAHVDEKKAISVRDFLATARPGGDQKARRFAVLVAQGDILRSGGGDLFGEDRVISPGGMARQIRLIANDPAIKGVILRVDSPGGDAIASDEILQELKELSKKKPLVISMSDVAASGGYYIAMTGDTVVAYPETFTGSIGVVYGKINLQGLYAKLGVTTEILKRGRFADLDSSTQTLTLEGRKKLRESIEFIYDGFLKRVSDGRHKTVEAIEPLAQGRVWLGVQARENGLVDDLGGLDKAIDILKKKANVSKDEQVRLVLYPRSKTLFEQLFSKGDAPDWATEPSDPSVLFRKLPTGVAPWLYGGMMRVMPYRLELR